MDRATIMKRFATFCKIRKYAETTVNNYTSCIKKFLDFLEPNIWETRDLDIDDAYFFLEHLTDDHDYMDRTYNVYVSALRIFYNGVYHRTGTKELLPSRRVAKTVKAFFTLDQALLLIEKCTDLTLRAQIALGAGCGLRISEVASLKFKHIKKGQNSIYVEESKWSRSRLVEYHDSLAKYLNEYCLTLSSRNPEDYLFPSKKKPSRHVTRNEITEPFNDYLKDFDFVLPDHSFHSLRHTYATGMNMMGVPLPKIQEQMGHTSAATTAMYIHSDTKWEGHIPDILKKDKEK